MDYKIERDTLFICDKYGFKVRNICDNVSYATFDDSQNLFLITKVNGSVILKDINGFQIRNICENAAEARFRDSEIIVRRKDGKNELRDKYGNIIRYI